VSALNLPLSKINTGNPSLIYDSNYNRHIKGAWAKAEQSAQKVR